MRTVLIPSTYNPYILYFWINNFKSNWYNSVDRVYLYLEGDLWNQLYLQKEPFFSNFEKIKDLCLDICKDPKIKIITDNTEEIRNITEKYKIVGDPRGKAFIKLISCCEGDYIFTSHDDFFFGDNSYLEEWFSDVESNKLDYVYFIGTNRRELYTKMSELYDVSFLKRNVPDWIQNEHYFPFGMTSYGFTSKLKLLLETDGDFTDKHFKPGDFIPELNYVTETNISIDYFHLTPLKWHKLNYKKVKSPGDGVHTDFKDKKQAPYAYLDIEDFCQYKYPYFHVCLGSSFFSNIILKPHYFEKEISISYASNASSAKILERFLYFNSGYIKLFPEKLIDEYKLRQFHETIKNNINIVECISDKFYKNMRWDFNKFEYFGESALLRYI